MLDSLKNDLENFLSGVMAPLSMELVDLKLRYQGNTIAVEVLADKPQGGITIEECSSLNKSIREYLEQGSFQDGAFEVEVSSPGLDRPLKTPRDFRRVIGQDVRFYLSEKIEGKLEHAGTVKDIQEDRVVVSTPSDSLVLPIEKINKAVQII